MIRTVQEQQMNTLFSGLLADYYPVTFISPLLLAVRKLTI